LPILLSITLFLLICWLTILQLRRLPLSMALPLAFMMLVYLSWIIVESRLAVAEVSKEVTHVDRGTCEFYAFGRAATVLAALALPIRWTSLGLWFPIGFTLFIAGVALRLSAIHVMGRFYSHRVRITPSHKIVTHGPYRVIRHPAYSGMILAHCGIVVCFFNVTSAAILLIILAPAVILRIRVEERVLFELQGYRDYAVHRARLIPRLW
jgi:protein-S-isoprenylcysteine O-methyltransferase Ste14